MSQKHVYVRQKLLSEKIFPSEKKFPSEKQVSVWVCVRETHICHRKKNSGTEKGERKLINQDIVLYSRKEKSV